MRKFVISEDHGRDTFFPKPEEGQSLISFLSSQDFHTCAELDKVFYLSDFNYLIEHVNYVLEEVIYVPRHRTFKLCLDYVT